jgi:hypothetical protein
MYGCETWSLTLREEHTYKHAYIPWIHKFVMATIGYGINHKDTKQINAATTK